MNPTEPIPAWLRKAEPVLAARVNEDLYVTMQEMGRRVQQEGFRSPRGRRHLAFGVGFPFFSLAGIGVALYLLWSNFWLSMIVLYGTIICQQVFAFRRHSTTIHENIMIPEVLKELWLAGCRGSEIACIPLLGFARFAPRFAAAFGLLGLIGSVVLAWVIGAGWGEAILLVATVTLAMYAGAWSMARLAAPIMILHAIKQRHGLGRSTLELLVASVPILALAGLASVGMLVVYIAVTEVVERLEGSLAMGTAVFCVLLSVALAIVYYPAWRIVLGVQQRWLDHLDELFDGYVRKALLHDPDAERRFPDVKDAGGDDDDVSRGSRGG